MKSMKLLALLLTLLVHPTAVFAQANGAGGGDTKTEAIIKNIRDNILEWINSGQYTKLHFNARISEKQYADGDPMQSILGMKAVLNPELGNVVVNVIKTSEEVRNDPELTTWIEGNPKIRLANDLFRIGMD